MHRFWDTIIDPVLEALQPETIVEVGSEYGDNTRKLLGFCQRHGAKLHVIDPLPQYDVAAWQEQYDGLLVFHRARSLDALPTIDRFDAVLLDGDHNWYTVYNELKLIEERCKTSSQPFPLVMLHDVGWPYGRRDGYYDPGSIPDEYRKPHKQDGIRPGSTELVKDGGLNRGFANAVLENDPRNGVLTAVEDFVEEAEQEIQMVQLPGLHGLGILVPSQLKEQNTELAGLIDVLRLSPMVVRYIEAIEGARLRTEIDRQERIAKLERRISKLERRIAKLEKENRALRDQSEESNQKILHLMERNQHLTQQLQGIQNSRSWQLLSKVNGFRTKVSGR